MLLKFYLRWLKRQWTAGILPTLVEATVLVVECYLRCLGMGGGVVGSVSFLAGGELEASSLALKSLTICSAVPTTTAVITTA